jgi:hypothetical protein
MRLRSLLRNNVAFMLSELVEAREKVGKFEMNKSCLSGIGRTPLIRIITHCSNKNMFCRVQAQASATLK